MHRSHLSENPEQQHEEQHDNQHERHHHPHALQVASLYHLVVRLQVLLAVLWTLPDRPQLAVPVARRRLIQLPVRRLERVDLRVGVVANALEALGQARRVLLLSVLYTTPAPVTEVTGCVA